MATLLEGGNLTINGKQADHLDLNATKRSFIVPILDKLLHTINSLYQQQFKTPLWDPKLLNDKSFLSGSSLHFFNVKGISDEQFVKVKPKVGDIDTMVDREKEANLAQLLTSLQGKTIGDVTLVGFQKGNEQYSSLWEIGNPPSIKVQIDFEFVDFNKGTPTDWAKFSHSSSWEDLQLRIKGVFHKFLIQSLASLTYRNFLQRKLVGRGKARAEQDVPMSDNMLSFAVSSKEGGGLRAKYVPVLDPATNKPLVVDGLLVMTAAPAANYEKDLSKIFTTLFGKKIDPKSLERTWSFNGLLDLMNKLLTTEQKQQIFNQFLQKTIGPGAQGLYKNDPNRDLEEKLVAINHAMKQLGISKPDNLDQMLNDYKKAYKMVAEDTTPNYKRQGIQHIYNPGSTVEIKDADFIELCKEIAKLGGKLDKAPINLKVDGAGIRFGKDQNDKPFFMTSKVTEPKYIENYGDFEQYGRSVGQDEQRLAFTKNYDEALKTILTADFMKDIPADTIVQAEMLYNPMAQKSDQGYKFVNIDYDPKMLGSTMTLVPFSVKQYSTGEPRKDSEQIKQKLLKDSTKQIKMVNNQLSQKDIDLSKIVDPVVKNSDALLKALKTRGDSPEKQQAKEIISLAKKKLSEAIYNSPNIKGKDQLGNNIEGLVINMPSGRLLKVTSPQMKEKMAAKKAQAPVKKGPSRTAVVAIGSFVGHKGHEELWDYTIQKAKEVGGDPYLFIGHGLGKDDPIPPAVKVKTWQTLYPEYKNNISTVDVQGGSLMQKIKHELINPMPGQPPKYDNIIIMVGEDQKNMNIAQALMKAVNKFPGYEHVKVALNPTPRGTGISFTQLRNILKDPNASEEQKLALWTKAFDVNKLGTDYIKYLMQVTEKGMTDLKEQIREFIESVKPLLPTATHEQRQKIHGMLSEAKKQLEAANAAQQAAIAISMKKAGKKPKKTVSETVDYLPEK